jgi:dipeptidyl aminopeptidase/acylaminoacyl peptidase
MESAFLFETDPATGTVRTVLEESAKPRMDLNSTSYNPPNVRVVAGGEELIWFSQRNGWGHLYLYDVATGQLKNRITKGEWLVRDIVHVDERRRRIYFTAGGREPGNPYDRYLYRVNFDGSALTLLSPERGDHLLTSPWNDVLTLDGAPSYEVVSPSGDYVVYNHAPLDQPTQAIIRTTDSGQLVSVFEEADATGLFAAGYRPPEEFVVKAADGRTDLYGVIYKPSNFDPARKYPVVDDQYASPLTAVAPRNFVQALRGVGAFGSSPALAELGFVVVCIDARGTTYRSREFSHWGYGQLNTMGLEDHVAALRQLAERIPAIDLDRVGIIGRSFGGWSTLRGMLEFPEIFKVGVAGVPPGSMHNMYLDYHLTAFHGRPEYSNGGDSRPAPAEVPRNWQNVDSRQQAGQLAGKLLIVMGELDEHVLPGSTLQFVKSLIDHNRDFELLYLPDTNHLESGSPYVTRRTWDFLVRHLQGVEPPRGYEIRDFRE